MTRHHALHRLLTWTAGLAALAIAVVAIIVTKVTGAANNIPTQ